MDGDQCSGLLFFIPLQQQLHMRAAKIWRKMNLDHGRRPDPRVGQLIIYQFVKFLAKPFGDALCTVRIQVSGYTLGPRVAR